MAGLVAAQGLRDPRRAPGLRAPRRLRRPRPRGHHAPRGPAGDDLRRAARRQLTAAGQLDAGRP